MGVAHTPCHRSSGINPRLGVDDYRGLEVGQKGQEANVVRCRLYTLYGLALHGGRSVFIHQPRVSVLPKYQLPSGDPIHKISQKTDEHQYCLDSHEFAVNNDEPIAEGAGLAIPPNRIACLMSRTEDFPVAAEQIKY
ncbi:MAG: hypothetical protein JWM68_2325 [Verrucomicrobiales bacterium]|nr:hypothetical protein [Verrucomicrobiales bacterium]